MYKQRRELVLEKFFGGEHTCEENCLRGAIVVEYLRREVMVFDECAKEYNLSEDGPDSKLRESFIEVLNYLADCTDNADMMIEEE